VLNPLKESK